MSNAPTHHPLHSVEHFMWADTRPTHPLTFFLKLEIAEQLDLQRLQLAVEQSVGRHPLLAATLQRRRGRWLWQPQHQIPDLEQHTLGHYPQSRQEWGIDLQRQAGWKMSLGTHTADRQAEQGSHSELWLQVHHSCADARGMLQFLRDVQAAYCPSTDVERAHPREQQASPSWPRREVGYSQRLSDYWNPANPKWKRIWGYYAHRSRPLAPSLSSTNSTSVEASFAPTYLSCQLPFSYPQWQRQRPQRTVDATVNDCVLHSLFRSLAAHHARLSPQQADPWLRVAVPIDMRSASEQPPMACNCSSMVFLDRRLRDILHGPALLADIHAEMKHVKAQRLGCVFFDVLALLHQLPGVMRLAVNDRRCAVSAVASNLGAVTFPVVEGFTVKAVEFFPPIRHGTAVALGISSYADNLHLSLHYDHRLISLSDARSLLADISGNMAGLFAESPVPAQPPFLAKS